MCSASAFCAWRRLLLTCFKSSWSVCVYERRGRAFAASVCEYRTSDASVELLPRGWRVVAVPRWLHVQSYSTWLILIVRCCFGGPCVRYGLASSVSVRRTSAASVELLPRGLRAVCFPRWLHVLSCSTWLIIVRCCIGGLCYFASLALTVILNSIRRAASSGC